jgi:hypothetical protein
MSTDYSAQINQAYQGVLRRAPTAIELAVTNSSLNNGYYSGVPAFIADLISQAENQNYPRPIIRLYQAIFNRKPDDSGLTFWVGDYHTRCNANGGPSNANLEAEAASWFGSAEYMNAYPTSMTTTQYVTAVYNNVFKRAPDQSGLDFWVNAIDTGGATRQSFIISCSESDEFKTNTNGPIETFQTGAANGDTSVYSGSLI